MDTIYSSRCIYCENIGTFALINDGGSIRYCTKCSRDFRAMIATPDEIMLMKQFLVANSAPKTAKNSIK